MKSLIKTLVVAACALLVLPSCNSKHISMRQYLPGVMDVNISYPLSAYGFSNNARGLATSLRNEWISRGGTTLNNGKPFLNMYVSSAGSSEQRDWATIDFSIFRGNTVQRRVRYYNIPNTDSTWRTLARHIVTDVLPGYRTRHYYVKVDKKKNIELYNACTACQRGNWTSGAAMLTLAKAAHPMDPEVWYLSGLIARHDGRFADAEANFRHAFSIKPSNKYSFAIRENHAWYSNHAAAMRQYGM